MRLPPLSILLLVVPLAACPATETAPDAAGNTPDASTLADAGETIDAGETPDAGGCAGDTLSTVDSDSDGFTPATGDCDECNADRNPGGIEFPGNSLDDDCDGDTDEPTEPCDTDLAADTRDAVSAAHALGLCVSGSTQHWGLLDARWTLPDGTAPTSANETKFHQGHGVLANFGRNLPREGDRALLLSTGVARGTDDASFVQSLDKGYTSNFPAGFPSESAHCPGTVSGNAHDGVALQLRLKVPTNAHGLAFDHRVFTQDWPRFLCTQYMDTFVAILSPTPAGLPNGNIAFDASGSSISGVSPLIDTCTCDDAPAACTTPAGTFTCSAGTADLSGTTYAPTSAAHDGAATRWLRTTAPVQPGDTITLTFTTWDSGDGVLDLDVLLDAIRFLPTAPEQATTEPLDAPPTTCGNESLDEGEACDGTESPMNCSEFGYRSGATTCSSGCGVDVRTCTPRETCRLYQDSNADRLYGCDDPDCTTDVACTDACTAQVEFTYDGGYFDLRGRPDAFDASCTGDDLHDAIVTFRMPRAGAFRLQVSNVGAPHWVSLRRGSCDLTAAEIECLPAQAFDSTGIAFAAEAGEVLTLIVEASAPAETGYFTVTEDSP